MKNINGFFTRSYTEETRSCAETQNKKLRVTPCVLRVSLCNLVLSLNSFAQEPGLSFRLEPELPVYYVGQQVAGLLVVDAGGYELHGNTAVANFMEPADAARYGAFTRRAGQNTRLAVYATPVVFLKEGETTFAPSINGQVSFTEMRGIFQSSRITSFRAAAEPLRVRVETLPRAGMPEGFSGAIGEFKLHATLEPRLCSPGDLLNLKWTLTGESAFNSPLAARYSPGADFRVYPPVADAASAPGAVVCRQVVIPQNTNATEAAALELHVFNPVRGEYEVLRAGPFELEVVERAAVDIAPIVLTNGGFAGTEFAGTAHDTGLKWPVADLFGKRRGEVFIVKSRTEAKLLPDARSMVLFEIPAGSIVEIRGRGDEWVFVMYKGASGWVRK